MNDATVALIKSIAEILLGLGGLGGLAALIGALYTRRKTGAEANGIQANTAQITPAQAAATLAGATTIISEAYRKLLDEYQESTDTRISELNTKISDLQTKNNRFEKTLRHYAQRIALLMTGIQMLIEQFKKAEIVPCWKPNEWHPEADNQQVDEPADPKER